MYTVRFQLELNASEKRFLSKSFFYANRMHNQIVRYATNRLNALFHDKEYVGARKAYGEAEFSKKKGSELSASEKKKKKELSDIMNNKQKEYGLVKGALYKFVSREQKKYKSYINSHQAQAEADAVYKGIEKVLFEDGHHLHYRRYNDFDCIKQKCAATGVRLSRWDTICFMKHYYKVRVPKNEYIQNIISSVDLKEDVVYDCYEKSAKINGVEMNLNPSADEVKKDIEELIGLFNNFDQFVSRDVNKLKMTHFKLLNAMFCSPYNAKLRCTAKIKGVPVSSLPLFMLATSKTSNCGKTFMARAVLKMMTGRELDVINKESCKKEDIRFIQAGCKGIPVFVDELDNAYLSRIKDIIKNPEKCEDNQLESQPMIVFASNEADEPDEIIRKRMVFLRFDGALPSTIDKSAYKGLGDAIIRRLGTGLYREYTRRMLDEVKELLDYMIYSKDRSDSWYPDLMAISSKTIISILEDYGYNIPTYMKRLTWNDDYADNAHFIAADTFNDIHEFYLKNKKAFTLTKDSIIIELGNDAASKKTLTSWVNTLPPEVQTKSISTRDCNKMTMNRREFESCSHIKFKRFGWF